MTSKRLLRRLVSVAVFLLPLVSDAEVKVAPAAVDFGKQRQEKTITATVKLTNAGDKPVQILRVGADCNCTAAQPEKSELAPGESTELKVTFETRSYQGEVSRTVLVQTTDGDVTIPVKAMVSQFDNWVFGANLAVFRTSSKGEAAETTFVLNYSGKDAIEVKDIHADVNWLNLRVLEHSGKTIRISLTKKPEAPAGTHQPKITVVTTDRKEPEVSFTAFLSVQSRLAVSPNPILLPMTKVGQPSIMSVSLQGWEAKDNPHGEITGGKLTVVERDGPDVLLEVSVTPDTVGVATRLLKLSAGESVEAEIPVIVRAE